MRHLWRKDEIVKKVLTSDQIIAHYIGGDISLTMKLSSPFRKDPSPSLAFYEQDGEILWTDFGMSVGHRRDGIGFVMTLFNEPYRHAVSRIYNDIICARVTPPRINKDIIRSNTPDVLVREYFSNSEKNYWLRYGITYEDLLSEYIYALHALSYDTRVIYQSTVDSPKYQYYFGKNSFKIYMPLERVERFRSYNISTVIERYNTLPRNGDTLIITSSTKDAIVLKKLGYASCAPTGETALRPILNKYSELSYRFKNIYIMLDNDPTGRHSTSYLEAHSNWRWKKIPFYGAKDVSDLVMSTSYRNLATQIKSHAK